MIEISSKILKGMLGATAKGDVRFYLNYVHLHGNTIEATNGHVCFRAKAAFDDIDEKLLVRLVGIIPKKSDMTTLDLKSNIATHRDFRGSIIAVSYIETTEGKFPDIEKLMSEHKSEPTSKIGFNPNYLASPAKLFGAIGVELSLCGNDNPAKGEFRSSGLKMIEMYLMPMRVQATNTNQ